MPAEERLFTQTLWVWMPSGSFQVDFGFMFDPLTAVMCMFVTGIGTLIHLYSIGYMKGDPNYSKFFLYLNLFIASMLLLVLGDNLVLTFLGWEGVGACSYLLISFWFTDRSNASAGKKAFVTNRIGDFGFMIATFLVFVSVGSVNYLDIRASAPAVAGVTATAIALLFFLAATGKSAQLPLFVWLPDAMAGPTPVSALIHAATMVTSGVFLLTRLSPIMAQAGWANDLIAWVGAATALLAAGAAVAQNDIKKVLAYSTISQLGFMFIAIGSQNYVGATFHMITHAFFKALLFLGAGSVIVAMAHEQDMRRYGNLRKYLPITFVTFMIGWLAISGIPPFSGFWSKDEILAGAFNKGPDGPALWAVGIIAAVLTAFYMTRLVIMTFFGGTEHWRTPEPELLPEGGVDPDVPAAAHARRRGRGPRGRRPRPRPPRAHPGPHPARAGRVHDPPAGGPGRPRRAGWAHEPAVHGEAGAPGPVAGAHHRRRARAAGRRRCSGSWRCSPSPVPSSACSSPTASTRSTRGTRPASSSRSWPTPGTSTTPTPRSSAGRVRRASRASRTSTRPSSTAPSTRWARAPGAWAS